MGWRGEILWNLRAVDDRRDWIKATHAAARYLLELHKQLGNWFLAWAGYNAGGGRIRKWLNGQSALPPETQNYVHVITGHPAKRWTFSHELSINDLVHGAAPHAFGVMSYSHFKGPGGGRAFLERIYSGDFKPLDLTDLN